MSGPYSLTVALHCATNGAPPGAAAGGSGTACVPHNGRLLRAPHGGGSVLIVEPAGADKPEDNDQPLGRLLLAASTAICLPGSGPRRPARARQLGRAGSHAAHPDRSRFLIGRGGD